MREKKKRIYLDNNATTRISPEVLDALVATYEMGPLNASSQHAFGHSAKKLLLSSREAIANVFAVPSDSILFFGSATEAINQLFHTFSSGHIISTEVDHAALYELTKKHTNTTFIDVDQNGTIDLDQLENAITEETSALFFSYANSETGSLFPIDEIAEIAKRRTIPLIVDGVAALGKTEITLHDGVTAMVFSGHKIHGPSGCGFIYLKQGAKLTPLVVGGGQERGIRSGTEAIPLIVGTAYAVSMISTHVIGSISLLRQYFETRLLELIPDIRFLGGEKRVANVSSVSFEGVDAESLLIRLDMDGVSASHGSACSAGAMEPSRVLIKMGYPISLVKSALRFSLSRYTTKDELDIALDHIKNAVEQQRAYA